jgi:excisionase family DNA binding protein
MANEDVFVQICPPSKGVAQTAPLLGISNRTLRRLAERREITYFKVGARMLFSDEDVVKYLDRAKVEARHPALSAAEEAGAK